MHVEQAGRHACGEVARRSKPLSLCWREARECETVSTHPSRFLFFIHCFALLLTIMPKDETYPVPTKQEMRVIMEEKLQAELKRLAPPSPTKKARMSTGMSDVRDAGRWMMKRVSKNSVGLMTALNVMIPAGSWQLGDDCCHRSA